MKTTEIKTTIESMHDWLNHYRLSPMFACDSDLAGCESYHVMAPILQSLGLFRSYQTYESIIQRVVADFLLTHSRVRLLVAGVQSEYSALAVLKSVAIFNNLVRVVFVDRCPTPLRRIERYIRPCGEFEMIETDIERQTDCRLNGAHDLVLADSFIRQFGRGDKVRILKRLAAATSDNTSRVIVHEYVGPMHVLLDRLWANMSTIARPSSVVGDTNLFMSTPEFREMLGKLDYFYRHNGTMYETFGELREDLSTAGMQIISEFVKAGAPDQLVVAELAVRDR